MAKKWAKTAQKMVKIKKNDCHHFAGSKLHNIMVLAVSTRCFKNFGPKGAKKGPKNGQISEKKMSSIFWLKTTSNKLGTNY